MERIVAFFIGVMCLLHGFSLAFKQSVKVGEKFIDFSDSGYLVYLPIIAFFLLSFGGFYFAFRSEKNIKKYIEFTRCKKCKKIYNFSDTKDMICPKCGGDLQDYAEFKKEQKKEKQDEFKEAEKFQEEWIKKIKEERK